MRLFVGIDVPAAVAETLARSQPPPAAHVSLLSPADMHVTLHFLGRCDRSAVEAALADVRAARFEIAVRGLGEFRMRGGKRILWAGIDRSAALDALHLSISRVLAKGAFVPETRPYRPHVTLAKLGRRAPRAPAAALLDRHGSTDFGGIGVAEFVLYDTAEKGDARRYRRLRRYPLDP